MPKPPPVDSPFWKVFGGFTKVHAAVFRATKGRIGRTMNGGPVLLLHHTGRKSGTERVSPLIYAEDGANLVLVASKGGVDKHPAWFHNLRAMDETVVELVGGERRRVRPRVTEGEERERLWNRAVAVYEDYAEYATYTERQIPVVVLEPAA